MIVKIKQNPEDFCAVRFVMDSSLLLCQTLGIFVPLMQQDDFFKSYPVITAKEMEYYDEICIDIIPNLRIIEEIFLLMKKLDFDLISKINGIREIYIFKHNIRKV